MYDVAVRVVAVVGSVDVVGSFESESAAAAAPDIVYLVVVGVVAVPACCRPSAPNARHNYIPGTKVWKLCKKRSPIRTN